MFAVKSPATLYYVADNKLGNKVEDGMAVQWLTTLPHSLPVSAWVLSEYSVFHPQSNDMKANRLIGDS